MPVIAPAGVDDVGAGRLPAAGRGLVSDEVREVLLGAPADDKACDACGAVRSAERWPVEVTFDGDRVAYVGRCPACDGRDSHRVVDPLGRW